MFSIEKLWLKKNLIPVSVALIFSFDTSITFTDEDRILLYSVDLDKCILLLPIQLIDKFYYIDCLQFSLFALSSQLSMFVLELVETSHTY
jgi:hypothetical protein